MSYYIRAYSRQKFAVEELNKVLYNVEFHGWTNAHAVSDLSNAIYTFEKESFWSSTRTIYRNNVAIGSLSFNWIGRLCIELTTEDGKDLAYILKFRGLLCRRIELVDNKNQYLLLTMYPEVGWFKYNYRIERQHRAIINYPLNELLGILGVGATLLRDRENSTA